MTREQFWNIQGGWLFYTLAAVALIVFTAGIVHRVWAWRAAGKNFAFPGISGVWTFLRDGLLGKRIFRNDPQAGIVHQSIQWGFGLLFLGTLVLAVDHYVVAFLKGGAYLIFSFVLEIAGLLVLFGILWALIRRLVLRVPRLETRTADLLPLAWLLLIVVTGFGVEAARLAAQPQDESLVSFTGFWVAQALPSGESARSLHVGLWWTHALLSLGFIAYLPYGKVFHALAAPTRMYLRGDGLPGAVPETDIATGGFSLHTAVGMDACVRCGRCVVKCPATLAGEGFSPRDAVQRGSRYARLKNSPWYRLPYLKPKAEQELQTLKLASEQAVWHCSTCGACVEQCPNYVSPLDFLRESRATVIEEGVNVPGLVSGALEGLYKRHNPWQAPKSKRDKWAKGLDVKNIPKDGEADLLYFVGCTTSFDTRAQEMARSLVAVMNHLGEDFGILGSKEPCCGDAARTLGEQGLFQELRSDTRNILEMYGVKKLFTTSPHCFHTLTNYYPITEGKQDKRVLAQHYTQVLDDRIKRGLLTFTRTLDRLVTFHDPCYLGRHNNIFEEPRNVIRAIPGARLVEMRSHHRDSLCCGGGGGRMWQEIQGEKKIAELRIEQALETGAQVLVTACPFCLIMLEDARKTAGAEDILEVKDLSELAAEAI